MSYTDKKIAASCTGLFEGLSTGNKIDLIETLSKSLKRDKKTKTKLFSALLEPLHQPSHPYKL
jgi:hypothetical protein